MTLRIERSTVDWLPTKQRAGDLAVFAACPRGMHELDRPSAVYLGARIAG